MALTEAEARCMREARTIERDRIHYQDSLDTNARQRRVVDSLQVQRSAQGELVRQLESDKCALTTANKSLANQLQSLRISNDSNVEQLRSLRLDNSALCEHLSSLAEHRDTLARRCAELEAEKDELKAKVALLAVDAADNEVLRAKISLLKTENGLHRDRDSETIQSLLLASQTRDENHQTEMQQLREQANGQQAVVQQQARAWELQWKETAKELHHHKQQHKTPTKTVRHDREESSEDDE